MAEDLFETISDEYNDIVIDRIERKGNVLTVGLLTTHNGDNLTRWTIKITNCVGQHISLARVRDLDLVDEDPVLLAFTNAHCELYFSENAANPHELSEALDKKNHKIMGDINPFSYSNLLSICGSKHGFLASGPETLISGLKEILDEKNVPSSIVNKGKRLLWNGEKMVAPPERLQALFIGDSWFIGESFEIKKL